MTKPYYTEAELASYRALFEAVRCSVADCQLREVVELWHYARENGTDHSTDLERYRREWNMPELSAADVEMIFTISSANSLTTERAYGPRIRKWFFKRGIAG